MESGEQWLACCGEKLFLADKWLQDCTDDKAAPTPVRLSDAPVALGNTCDEPDSVPHSVHAPVALGNTCDEPASVPHSVHVSNTAELIREVKLCDSPGLYIFTGVTPAIFEAYWKTHNRFGRPSYFAAEKTLFVKMAGPEHEAVNTLLMDGLNYQSWNMRLSNWELHRAGSARFNAIHPDKSAMVPDDGFIAQSTPDWTTATTTFIVEVAASQRLKQAQQKKDFWFIMRAEIKLVMIADIIYNQAKKTINFELWHRAEGQPSITGGIRLKNPQEPIGGRPDGSLYEFDGTVPLPISFEDVMLRPKRADEQDLFVTADMMVQMATRVFCIKQVSHCPVLLLPYCSFILLLHCLLITKILSRWHSNNLNRHHRRTEFTWTTSLLGTSN